MADSRCKKPFGVALLALLMLQAAVVPVGACGHMGDADAEHGHAMEHTSSMDHEMPPPDAPDECSALSACGVPALPQLSTTVPESAARSVVRVERPQDRPHSVDRSLLTPPPKA